MKKIILPFIIISAVLVACGPTKDDAVNFNDQIVSAQKSCLKAEGDFYDVCDKLNPDDIKKAFADFQSSVNVSVKKIEEAEAHDDFDAYRQSAVNLLNAYKKMLDLEFANYADLYCIPTKDFTEADEERQKELSAKINTSLDLLNKNFIAEQQRFADKWDFTLAKKTY